MTRWWALFRRRSYGTEVFAMKRAGVGARDSPTKERYAGKRQQQQAGRGGGRRQKPGSRDVSPAPSAWPSMQPSTASQTLSPHQLAMHQQHLAETAGKTPVHELIAQIKKLPFPALCGFVLGLLEKYVRAHLTNDAVLKVSLPKKTPLLTLLTYFILRQPVMVKAAGKKSKIEQRPTALSPLEELQVMMAVVKKIEEQSGVDQQFCMFEALFGGCIGTIRTGSRAGESFFERVVCLAVSLHNSAVLSCVALWMQSHQSEAVALGHSLYSCFCEHLPNASEPLVQIASLSPQLAQQLTTAFIILFPFHIVGTPVPGVDTENLCPPDKLLSILSHWVEKDPQFLYASRLLETTDLISFHGSSAAHSSYSSTGDFPLAGLMRWCVLAPCYHPPDHSKPHQNSLRETPVELLLEKPSENLAGKYNISGKVFDNKDIKSDSEGKEEAVDFRTQMAKLHANLLSVVLSDSQSFAHDTLTSDHIAVTVAALLGLSRHQPAHLKRRGKTTAIAAAPVEERAQGDVEKHRELEESVERLAQFLQISLSTGLLNLSPENLSSLASTLPVNKLLSLVISHNSSRR